MTKNYEYNQNLVFTNEETHKALVSHFNQIEEFAKNKKFEWENEELTETYNITCDFDEFFSNLKKIVLEDYLLWKNEVPENFDDDLIEYANQLKDYVNGFVLGPTGMYRGKTFSVETYKADTFDEIVEHMKQVLQDNQMVFLYVVLQKPKRPKEIVMDGVTYLQDLSTYYRVSYGVLN